MLPLKPPDQGKANPYCSFKDDRERRAALNFSQVCLTLRHLLTTVLVSVAICGLVAHPEAASKIYWLIARAMSRIV
jgi:hypothetical protein